MSDTVGPHKNGSSGTAHDLDQFGPQSSSQHDSEGPVGTQDQRDPSSGSQTPTATPVYDSGWTARNGFNVRVRWYGMPDDGSRRRWVSDVLSRHSRKTTQS